MSRRETLLEALKDARAAHQHNPSRRSFDMVRGAANRIKQYDEHLARLQEQLRSARLIYNHEAIANIEGKIRMHTIANGLVSGVKLVDTAGTIRLDLNDRRVFMTRAQASELFLKLGNELASPESLNGYVYSGGQVECAMDAMCLAAYCMRGFQ